MSASCSAPKQRREFEQWEGDLILSRQAFGPQNLPSLVGRTTRFAVLMKNDSKRSEPVISKITSLLRDLPHYAQASAPSDRLNATPRKCLGWRTPAEAFKQKMLESTA